MSEGVECRGSRGSEGKKIFLYRGLLLLQRFQINGDFNLT